MHESAKNADTEIIGIGIYIRINMSAYQANVKVEQLAEGGSARTPGSIVASSTIYSSSGVGDCHNFSSIVI